MGSGKHWLCEFALLNACEQFVASGTPGYAPRQKLAVLRSRRSGNVEVRGSQSVKRGGNLQALLADSLPTTVLTQRLNSKIVPRIDETVQCT